MFAVYLCGRPLGSSHALSGIYSVLSLPYLLDGVVPMLAEAMDGTGE